MNANPDKKNDACPTRADIASLLADEPDCKRAEIEKHVATCAECREALADFSHVVDRLRDIPVTPLERDLTADVLARVRCESDGDLRKPVAWRPVPVLKLAAGLLIVIGGLAGVLSLFRYGPDSGSDNGVAQAGRRDTAGETEKPSEAVVAAVRWLERVQEPDGRWSSERWGTECNYEVGVSSLALLAVMSANHPAGGMSVDAVRRGVAYLVSQQDTSGRIGPEFAGTLYNQGLATLAMVEATERSGDISSNDALKRALDYICQVQAPFGGWGYLTTDVDALNSSASVWPLLALIRAKNIGVPDLEPNVARGMRWLKSVVNNEGLMGYARAGDFRYGHETLTAAGAVCLLAGGQGEGRRELQLMLKTLGGPTDNPDVPLDFYRTYFRARACVLADCDGTATGIDSALQRLAGLQVMSGQDSGSWDAVDQWGKVGGRVYSTAMASLTMQCN